MRSGRAHGRVQREAIAGVLAACALASVSLAGAQSSIESYDVPAECQGQQVWTARLHERLPAPLRTHALVETLTVRVSGAPGQGYAGRVSSAADASLNSPREVRGESCDDVLDALAFAAALGLERTSARPASSTLAAPDTVEARTSRNAEAPDALSSNTPVEDAVTRSVVVFAQFQPGLTPASMLELGAAFRLAWSTPTWQPLFLIGVYAGAPRETRLAGRLLRFVHWSSLWVGCPWRFPRQGSFALRPCLELELGHSSGEGLGFDDAAKYDAPWLSGGAQLRAQLALGRHWELGAAVDAVVPFWHSHFYLVPDQMAFETPRFGLRAGASGGFVF